MTKAIAIAQQVLERLKYGTGARSDSELARTLGISQQSVSNARNNGKVPDSWVRCTAEQFNLNADWLFFGRGDVHAGAMPPVDEDQGPANRLASPGGMGWGACAAAQSALRIGELERQLAAAKEETLAAYRLIAQNFPALSKAAQESMNASGAREAEHARESFPQPARCGDGTDTQ